TAFTGSPTARFRRAHAMPMAVTPRLNASTRPVMTRWMGLKMFWSIQVQMVQSVVCNVYHALETLLWKSFQRFSIVEMVNLIGLMMCDSIQVQTTVMTAWMPNHAAETLDWKDFHFISSTWSPYWIGMTTFWLNQPATSLALLLNLVISMRTASQAVPPHSRTW